MKSKYFNNKNKHSIKVCISKYIYTIKKLLDLLNNQNNQFNENTRISDLLGESITEIDWMKTLIKLELLFSINIPDKLFKQTGLTLEQFANELSKIPTIPDELYPEFYKVRIKSISQMRLNQKPATNDSDIKQINTSIKSK